MPVLVKRAQQPVAFFQQSCPVLAGMDLRRGVREYRQRGGLAPGKLIGRPSVISPGSGFQADDIPAERRV